MSNSGDLKRRGSRSRLLFEHPIIASTVGGIATVVILAVIGRLTHLVGHISDYMLILLTVGVIVLIGGLPLLIRYRAAMNAWLFTSVTVLVLAGSALIGATAANELSRSPSIPTKPATPAKPANHTASCQDPLRVGLTVSDYGLRTCDCINVPKIRQGGHLASIFDTVSCERSHDAEVFFSGNNWPSSTAYPGENKVNADTNKRCLSEFTHYVGQVYNLSAYNYHYWYSSGDAWTEDHARHIACAAYLPSKPVNGSIKGSHG